MVSTADSLQANDTFSLLCIARDTLQVPVL